MCLCAGAALALIAWGVPAAHGAPAGRMRGLYQAAAQFEVQPMAERPAWAARTDSPLMTVGWLSDFHLAGGRSTTLATMALRYAQTDLAADVLIITGDNCSRFDPDTDGTPELRRQRFFRRFLGEHVTVPYALIPGDNWPWAFEEVFGPFQFSLDVGGLHLVFLAPDRAASGVEGCTVFEDSTLAWLREDLAAASGAPALVCMHEPVFPPTFLDAPRCLTVLEEAGNVLATLAGHLHLDLGFERNGVQHLTCPAVGPSPRHGFKELRVYPDMILVLTHECEDLEAGYRAVPKWQRIVIPERFRAALQRPADVAAALARRHAVPAHPRIRDPRLAERSLELFGMLSVFLMENGLRALE